MGELFLKVGLGGIISNELLTFDFTKGDKLKPYACKILGRDFEFGFKREFVERQYQNYKKKFYDGREMVAITFKLERHVVYEYKRFAGDTLGEVVDGYFVILRDSIRELQYEEVMYWCGTAKEKERMLEQKKVQEIKNYVPDDIDF